MEKPRSTVYGIRLLYATAIVFTIVTAYLPLGLEGSKGGLALAVAFGVLIAGWFYLVRLLSKGSFWIRSIFLALTIFNCLQVLHGISAPAEV